MGIQGLVIPFKTIAETTQSLAELAAAMTALTAQLGFQYFALSRHVDASAPDATLRLHNYPTAWAELYDRKDWCVVDPVHRRSHLGTNGFWWSQMDAIEPLSRLERQIMDRSREQGIGEGYTVPTHLPGEPGTCTFANPIGQPAFPNGEFLARLAGAAAFEAARRLFPKRRARTLALRPPLTRQQIVIINLLADGKTNYEIGCILGISEETAGSHVRDLFARYGVNKRTLLVSLACQDGYLT